jgi:hypothetical protein
VAKVAKSLDMLDLQLMYNYTTATCFTLTPNAALKEVWRLEIPKLAFQWDFVMRGLLAISALHLAHFKPDKREYYTSYALTQHNLGLREAIPLLLNINEDNCSALFIFSSLHIPLAMARPRQTEDFLLFKNEGPAELLILIRGLRAVIDSSADTLMSGPLSSLFRTGMQKTRVSAEQLGEIEPLRNLRAIVNEYCDSESDRNAYMQAIDELAKCFARISSSAVVETSEVFVWFWRLSERYLDLVKERRPEALSIFGFFCVLLKRLEPMWWMHGWSVHLLDKIYHSLAVDVRYWIRWPIEELGWVPD